jgi:hypothetical protein
VYVATGGVDTLGCGSRLEPCQSISRAILLSRDGDTVIVGAGRYGDANSDGDLDDPGDEAGPIASGCHCVVLVNKAVRLETQDGTGSVTITGPFLGTHVLVQITASGAAFGRNGRGFLLVANGGVEVTAPSGVTVVGNRFMGSTGIQVTGAKHTISENALYKTSASVVGSDHLVARNTFVDTTFTLDGTRHTVVGNVVTANSDTVILGDAHSIRRNSFVGSRVTIISDGLTFSENNFLRDSSSTEKCVELTPGRVLEMNGLDFLDATNNYWGAPTGPGPDPAVEVCNMAGSTRSTTAVSPWATQPFDITLSRAQAGSE